MLASFAQQIARRLQRIYGSSFNETTVNRILAMIPSIHPAWPDWDESDIILITYGDSITSGNEKPLWTLHRFLKQHLGKTISTVHILPFFPFTSDDGFAVTDYTAVNPALGTWHDIRAITDDFYLMADLVINHVSSAHPWFRNYLQNRSPGKGYFIEGISGEDYSIVVRPRSSALFTKFQTSEGEKLVWTTFSDDQADLDFSNQEVLLEMIRVMLLYIKKGARFIRLDAIAYLWKCNGTGCLHLNQTHEIVKLLRDIASFARPGTVIITETNVPNRENWSYFGKGDEAHMVYQFSLPPLMLYSLYFGHAAYLTEWARQLPEIAEDQTFLNYTASHDGIGVRPLEGIIDPNEVSALINGMTGFGGLVSMKMNSDGSRSPYEINIAWFDAMKGSVEGQDQFQEQRFITSQAIMMALKGIPAFYIHSLLATANDHKGIESTGRARSINRRKLREEEVKSSLSLNTVHSRIFSELTRLIGIRKQQPAFHPGSGQQIIRIHRSVFAFERFDSSGTRILCVSNMSNHAIETTWLPEGKRNSGSAADPEYYDLISGVRLQGDRIVLKPCETQWILIPV